MKDANEHLVTAKITPRIYAYTEAQYKTTPWAKRASPGFGLLKVGYTTKENVSKRIWEQYPTLKPVDNPFEIIVDETAETVTGSYFMDHSVHKELERLGAKWINGEWFECTKEEVLTAINNVKTGAKLITGRYQTFGMRPEQADAVNATRAYYAKNAKGVIGKPPHFLWNAKMRFGKTFTSYMLAKTMGLKKILILTYKPGVKSSWEKDLESHVEFADWTFQYKEEYKANETKPVVFFASFQDILGKSDGEIKEKFKQVFDTEWDIIILDEYHFGSWKDKAKDLLDDEIDASYEVIEEIEDRVKAKHFLYLSGTPFRALRTGEFSEDAIFNWTYQDEQRAKITWDKTTPNPYTELPKLVLLTYQIEESIRKVAIKEENNEFDLNSFFKADTKTLEFTFKDEVQRWIDVIKGKNLVSVGIDAHRPPLPFEDTRLLPYLKHTVWFLPDVASCKAMQKLLTASQNSLFHEYKILLVAGNSAGMGADALLPVEEAIGPDPRKTKTITLTCGKLLTGVTVAAWTGIFMLRNLKSPETYFQAAFRVQSPWVLRNADPERPHDIEILKDKCFVFDFAPNRALAQIAEYCSGLNNGDSKSVESKVGEFLHYLPVLCYDQSSMKELDAGELLDIVISGTGASMLARKWQSAQLVVLNKDIYANLLANPALMATLKKITAHRSLNKLSNTIQAIVNAEETVKKAKKEGTELTAKEKIEVDEAKDEKENLKDLLVKFITRIPIFMYLTDYREEALKHVIKTLDSKMFERTTGILVSEFEGLCEAGIFNDKKLNVAIFAFRLYETASLDYTGKKLSTERIGGFEPGNELTRTDAEEVVANTSRIVPLKT
jgi:hypothetical protein